MPWDVLHGQRSLARARAGYLRVGHLRGRRTRAQVQTCALCGSRILAGTAHAVFLCSALAGPRDVLAGAVGAGALRQASRGALVTLLRLSPGQPGYCELVRLLGALDSALSQFWREQVGGDS